MLVISSSKGGVHICPGVSDNDSFIHLYLSVSPFVLLISLFIYCFCEGDIAPYKSTIGQHFMKFRWLLWVKYHLCPIPRQACALGTLLAATYAAG
ncbi:MAG: hypothetical protein ABL862_07250 [Candidatus Nitrotoga sp.]